MPTKRLPSRPNLDQLRRQAKELLTEQRAGTLQACQRIREFHPRYAAAADDSIKAATLALSDGQLTIAREYGFASWARLRASSRRPVAAATRRSTLAPLSISALTASISPCPNAAPMAASGFAP